jgi:hypothetical protein
MALSAGKHPAPDLTRYQMIGGDATARAWLLDPLYKTADWMRNQTE